MISPSVMFLESTSDAIKDIPIWLREDQQKELTSFGDVRAQNLGATGLSNDFRKGYEFGLQVARTMIQGSVALSLKGINPDDVL